MILGAVTLRIANNFSAGGELTVRLNLYPIVVTIQSLFEQNDI